VPFAGEFDLRLIDNYATDNVMHRLANQYRIVNISTKSVIAKDRRTACRGKPVERPEIVETIQRMQETLCGKADGSIPLHAVLQFDQPIVVPPEKAPRGKPDPLLEQLGDRLTTMLDALSFEANPIENHNEARLVDSL